jgi:hypothetical protein
MNKMKDDGSYSADETARRRDEVIRRMANTRRNRKSVIVQRAKRKLALVAWLVRGVRAP